MTLSERDGSAGSTMIELLVGGMRSDKRGEAGITMIELLVGMVIVTSLSVMSVSGWSSYREATEHRGAAEEVVSTLRNAQQRSLAEAAAYCVTFDAVARTHQLYKFACGPTGTAVGGPKSTQSQRVFLQSPVFQQPTGGTDATVTFYPRGAATRGSVQVAREGADRTYTIEVEGLTGRVRLDD